MIQIRTILALVIVGVGVLFSTLLYVFKQTPPKTKPSKQAALVSVFELKPSSERVLITGHGIVEAARELELRPQVTGHVVELHNNFEIGGRIEAGEVLLKVDPRDYEIALDVAKAARARAEFELKLEEGNQIVSAREWELLKEDIEVSKIGRDLALRKPQLREKRAALDAAESRVEEAELNLERVQLKTPFSAIILEESVEVGKYVSPQITLGRIVSVDEFQIRARISNEELRHLQLADDGTASEIKAVVFESNSLATSRGREGRLKRVLGEVDKTGRMALVLISVPNPLEAESGQMPLLIGSYVRVEIVGEELSDGFLVPRAGIREGEQVWIVDEQDKLDIRNITVVFGLEESVYIVGELNAGEKLVVNPLPRALEGMLLEVVDEAT